MASETGAMESAHAKQPNIKTTMPAFHFFLCRNHVPVKIKRVIKIPGGNRKGVTTFLNIYICQFPLLIRALIFRQDHKIKKDIFAFPAGDWKPRKKIKSIQLILSIKLFSFMIGLSHGS